MTPENTRKTRFFQLMDRYIRLGQLLPTDEPEDADAIDKLRLVLKEMAATQDEMYRVMTEQAVANN